MWWIPSPSSLTLPTDLQGWGLLTLAVVLFLFAALGVPLYAYRAYRIARTDPVRIGEAQTGETVEIEGTVEPLAGSPTAPMTGDPAAAYEYEVRAEKTFAGRTDDGWRRLDSGRATHPFLVDDDTGVALVDPERADVQFGGKTRGYIGADERPPPEVERHLDVGTRAPWDEDAPVGEFSGMDALDRSVEYTEWSVTAGDTVHVRGPTTDPPALRGSDGTDRTIAVGIGGNDGLGVAGRITAALPGASGDNPGSGFLVSAGGESSAVRGLLKRCVVSLSFAVVVGGVTCYFLFLG